MNEGDVRDWVADSIVDLKYDRSLAELNIPAVGDLNYCDDGVTYNAAEVEIEHVVIDSNT